MDTQKCGETCAGSSTGGERTSIPNRNVIYTRHVRTSNQIPAIGIDGMMPAGAFNRHSIFLPTSSLTEAFGISSALLLITEELQQTCG